MDRHNIQETGRMLAENIETVMIGKHREIVVILSALFARGHVLLEDVPGTGKTLLAKSLARSIGCAFGRVQFTPDLLPSDLTGINVYSPKTGDFTFKQGSLFTNILLADEINRATPRTQSGLLESMEERQITVDGVTYPLSPPYFVIATQNPIDKQGTFPLPEAQLDRFMIRLALGAPDLEETVSILERFDRASPFDALAPVINGDTLCAMQAAVHTVFLHPDLRRYIAALTHKTRVHNEVALGISARGSLALMHIAKAYAAMDGRDYVIPEDIQTLVPYVFLHRLITHGHARDQHSKHIIEEVISSVPVPMEDWGGR